MKENGLIRRTARYRAQQRQKLNATAVCSRTQLPANYVLRIEVLRVRSEKMRQPNVRCLAPEGLMR